MFSRTCSNQILEILVNQRGRGVILVALFSLRYRKNFENEKIFLGVKIAEIDNFEFKKRF